MQRIGCSNHVPGKASGLGAAYKVQSPAGRLVVDNRAELHWRQGLAHIHYCGILRHHGRQWTVPTPAKYGPEVTSVPGISFLSKSPGTRLLLARDTHSAT